jgi:hypothetical protein
VLSTGCPREHLDDGQHHGDGEHDVSAKPHISSFSLAVNGHLPGRFGDRSGGHDR